MELNKKIYKSLKNATIRINNGQIIITKEKNGYKLNKDKLKNTLVEKIVNMDCSEEIIPIITIKPVYLYEDLSKIDTVLGRFETYFNSQNYNRSTNIVGS